MVGLSRRTWTRAYLLEISLRQRLGCVAKCSVENPEPDERLPPKLSHIHADIANAFVSLIVLDVYTMVAICRWLRVDFLSWVGQYGKVLGMVTS